MVLGMMGSLCISLYISRVAKAVSANETEFKAPAARKVKILGKPKQHEDDDQEEMDETVIDEADLDPGSSGSL